MKKAAVALSGGVDSAAAALMLINFLKIRILT